MHGAVFSQNCPSLMTTQDNPERLAAELLAEVARSREAAAVPLLLRSPELMALPAPLRARVLAHARRGNGASPKTVLALVLYGAAVLALMFTAAPGRLALLLPVLAAIGWLPAWLLHIRQVRRSARRLAADLAR
jgi:hypothetical protein